MSKIEFEFQLKERDTRSRGGTSKNYMLKYNY